MAAIIRLRRDTSTNWNNVNPVLATGETGYETDTRRIKVGNGASAWNILPYIEGTDISLLAATSGSWNSNYTTTSTSSANWNAAYAYATTYPLLTAIKTSNISLSSTSYTNVFTVPAGRVFIATGLTVIFDSGIFTNLSAGSIRLTRNNVINSANRIIADLNIGIATYSNNTLLRRGSINDNVNAAQSGETVQIAMNTLTTAYTASVITEGILY